MKTLVLSILILTISLKVFCVNNTKITVPISQQSLFKVTLSVNRLADTLKQFQTGYQNKTEIYNRLLLTRYYLNGLSGQIQKLGNLIIGSNNTINGRKNIIVGNRNDVSGVNNWVFVTDFKGHANSNLVVGIWKIDMLKLQFVPINPMIAISYIDDAANTQMKNKYLREPRQVCQFGSWAKNMNSDQQNFYSQFAGFNNGRYQQQQTYYQQPYVQPYNQVNQQYNNQYSQSVWINRPSYLSKFSQNLFKDSFFGW